MKDKGCVVDPFLHSHEAERVFGILIKRKVGRSWFVFLHKDHQLVERLLKLLEILGFGKGEESNNSNGHGKGQRWRVLAVSYAVGFGRSAEK
jgi:hypothetical protein